MFAEYGEEMGLDNIFFEKDLKFICIEIVCGWYVSKQKG